MRPDHVLIVSTAVQFPLVVLLCSQNLAKCYKAALPNTFVLYMMKSVQEFIWSVKKKLQL